MALNLPLPRNILTHAHWTINHEKMSKSTGNVVNPNFAIERFGTDPMRFYLAIDGGLSDDADYENSHVVRRYTKELQGSLGNLTSRMVRGKKWNVRESIECAAEGKLPPPTELDTEHEKLLESVRQQAKARMDNLDPRKALNGLMNFVHDVRTRYVLVCYIESTALTKSI